ncbi:hypothetical protein [Roseibium sp.]|uniref:hypothetical protein n=1 Tax=Roseibium sp. TaxID=1936156 RepID=UPI0032972990
MQDLKIPNIDQHGVNSVLCAIEAELAARPVKKGNKPDAILMGGGRLCSNDVRELAHFACRKNWNILYAAMDEIKPLEALASGDLEFSYFSTDGVSETAVLTKGKIWKRDRQSHARLIFGGKEGCEIWMKASGSFAVRDLKAAPSDQGFHLSRASIKDRMDRPRRMAPVVTSIGQALLVYDMMTLLRLTNGE